MDRFEEWYEQHFERDVPQPMTDDQRWVIADLMERVTLTDREVDGYKIWFTNGPSYDEADDLITELVDRLPHPVTERGRYNQTQITKHIKQICGL